MSSAMIGFIKGFVIGFLVGGVAGAAVLGVLLGGRVRRPDDLDEQEECLARLRARGEDQEGGHGA